ncbi:unnamed protein product [Allacma fusca]|uniref:F-box domain-containing protein n=1 Tax=Allacma fusca TaxID=39272 RepID=A0A8J2LDD5_9HEXA|nr:unnamed protein product [Allacma fusca]
MNYSGEPKDAPEYERDFVENNANSSYPKDKGPYLDLAAVAPSPSRDYFRIYVTKSEVALTQWRISHGPRSAPTELKIPLESFARDLRIPSEVNRVFGKECVDYITGLSQGHVDKIMQLPNDVLAKIFFNTGIENLKNLAPVCRKFASVCRGNDLWKRFYLQYGGTDATKVETKYQADYLSWKHLFFINRLQYKIGNPERFPGLFSDLNMNIPKGPRHQAQSSVSSSTSVTSWPSRRHLKDTSSTRKFIRGRTARIVDGNLIPRASAANISRLQDSTKSVDANPPRQKYNRYTLVNND